jgi:hypothetical protein
VRAASLSLFGSSGGNTISSWSAEICISTNSLIAATWKSPSVPSRISLHSSVPLLTAAAIVAHGFDFLEGDAV